MTDSHEHLGILKSGTRLDPTDTIISKGLKPFYALHGAGAHTLGLTPMLSAHLWNTFCIPRMLYGITIYHLTKAMMSKLDRGQSHLFKRILGVPTTAADESLYLLTGLPSISRRIDLEKLLLLGQVLNLEHSRFERRTLLHAVTCHTTTIASLKLILLKYDLPQLEELITVPIPYSKWKLLIKRSITTSTQKEVYEAIPFKPSLGLWHGWSLNNPRALYPMNPPSSIVRQALIARAQLLTSTYLLQTRLHKIKSGVDPTCPHCKEEDETIVHFIATCNSTSGIRQEFVKRHRNCLLDLPSPPNDYGPQNSGQFTRSTLLSYDPGLPQLINHDLLLCSLHFIYKLHIHHLSSN